MHAASAALAALPALALVAACTASASSMASGIGEGVDVGTGIDSSVASSATIAAAGAFAAPPLAAYRLSSSVGERAGALRGGGSPLGWGEPSPSRVRTALGGGWT